MTTTAARRRANEVPTLVGLAGPRCPGRVEAEDFVHRAFALAYGARLAHFLPSLMTLRSDHGQLLALPVLGLLIWAVVGRALAPLQRAAQEVARRAPDALESIDDRGAPREVQGLLHALNRLFARLRAALDRERQFTADAAHELRTPLAALKTSLQVARAQSAEAATRRSLAQALAGVDRATHTLEQLLSMARADAAGANALGASETDLRALAIAAVSALSQQAVEGDIDLGIDAPRPALVHGDPAALQVMLRNLVDNAVRYTPAVGEREDARWIAVRDDGPGVAAGEQERIFERFQRGRGGQSADTVGSGLGLSIVRRIAGQHGARVAVGEGLGGRGLGVAVSFPRGRDAEAAQAAD